MTPQRLELQKYLECDVLLACAATQRRSRRSDIITRSITMYGIGDAPRTSWLWLILSCARLARRSYLMSSQRGSYRPMPGWPPSPFRAVFHRGS